MTQALRILVVDDEPQIQRFLRPSLVASGYAVLSASTGAEALRQAGSQTIAAIILDLGLPDMDGKDVLEQIRHSSDVPIVILSARDRETEKIAALDLGADDYVNKPFGIGELLARLRSVLRRRSAGIDVNPTTYEIGPIIVDLASHQVMRRGQTVHLTPKEFDLLALLFKHAGRVMTHRQILTNVWGPAHGTDMQYLRVFIGQLRQKLEDEPTEPQLILTEPGIGYRVRDAE
jgi:two-component system, OmpR family, KDP operon response regulator KdpE